MAYLANSLIIYLEKCAFRSSIQFDESSQKKFSMENFGKVNYLKENFGENLSFIKRQILNLN